MKKLDYAKLQPLSANINENKNTKAFDSDTCKSNIDDYLDNYKDYLLINLDICRCAMTSE